MFSRKRVILFCLCFCTFLVSGQSTILREANKLFEGGNYDEALSLYNRLKKIDENGTALLYRGITYYYLNQPNLSINDLKKSHTLKKKNPINYLYSAKSFYLLGEYEEAAQFYKTFLKKIRVDDPIVLEIVEEIKRCNYNIKSRNIEQKAFVENMGPSVNTSYNEVLPRQTSSQPSTYYFSSDRDIAYGGKRNTDGLSDDLYGQYNTDMYGVTLKNGNWSHVFAFNKKQNTEKNEVIQGFSSDGRMVYFLSTFDLKSANLYIDTFNIDQIEDTNPLRLISSFLPDIGDKDLLTFNDSTWLFSSKRVGGYGGYDLYIVTKSNGTWSRPINLGSKINSKYDEISPFLTKGGHILSFSSNRLNGLGGFDIFTAEYDNKKEDWNSVINMGKPINSPSDDTGFFISSDGTQAIFSSNRIDGYGGSDLYLAYLKQQMIDQLMFTEKLSFGLDTSTTEVGQSLFGQDSTLVIPSSIDKEPEEVKIEAREFVNLPLYFTSEDEILSIQNKIILANIKDILNIYPDTKVILTSHSNDNILKDISLYFSVKRAEKIVSYMHSLGIDSERFIIKGCGSNFPVANTDYDRIANQLNNRIDINFYNYDAKKLNLINEFPSVNKVFGSQRFPYYLKSTSGLSYSLEIAETQQMYKGDIIHTNEDVFIIKSNSGNYKYYVGLINDYTSARNFQNELIRKNIIPVKIFPFIDGINVNYDQIQQNIDKYKNLSEFIKYENE